MAKPEDAISDELRDFIQAQRMFFVATAPLAATGHVNLSPKGHDCFRVLSPKRVAYLDLTGSGNETSAHLMENGRITFMFCAFEGRPRILRLYGTGFAVLAGSAEWEPLAAHFDRYRGTRQIVVADITRVMTSCGYAVPRYDFVEQRETLLDWTDAKLKDAGAGNGLEAYWRRKNLRSIDGLPTPLAETMGKGGSEL